MKTDHIYSEFDIVCNNHLHDNSKSPNFYLGVNILQKNLVQIFSTNYKEFKSTISEIIITTPLKTKAIVQMLKDKQFFLAYIYGLKSSDYTVASIILF